MRKLILFYAPFFLLLHLNIKAQSQFQQFFTPYLNPIEQELLSSDDIIVVGNNSMTNSEMVIAKFNPCGKLLWSKKAATQNKNIQLVDLKVDTRNNILITGNLFGKNTKRKVFVMSMTDAGLLNYFKVFNSGTADIVYSLDLNDKDEVYLYFKVNIAQVGPKSKNIIAKLDDKGNTMWIKEYGFTGIWGQMFSSSNGGLLLSDSRSVVKIDSKGAVLWNRNFDKSYYAQDPFEIAGGFVFFRYAIASKNQSYAMMLNSDGSVKWNSQMLPDFRPHKGILRKNGNLLFIGNIRNSTKDRLTFVSIDTADGTVLKPIIQHSNPISIFGYDLNELDDGSIIYSGNEHLTLTGRSFISRLNDSLRRINCKDSVIQFNTSRNNGITQSAPTWTGNHFKIPLDPMAIQLKNYNLTMAERLCIDNYPLTLDLGRDTVICPNRKFSIGASAKFDAYRWSNGKTTKEIDVTKAGKYWLTAWVGCDTISDTIQINYRKLPILDLGKDTTICSDKPLLLSSKDTVAYWSTGDTSKRLSIHQAGTYWAKIPSICGYIHDTIVVKHFPEIIEPKLGNDTSICYDDSIRLSVEAGDNQLRWSTGGKTETITVNTPGLYHVTIWNACDTVQDRIKVSLYPKAKLNFTVSKYKAKILDSIHFQLTAPERYKALYWQFDDGKSSRKKSTWQVYTESGMKEIKLLVTDSLSCSYDSIFKIEINKLSFRVPNVFSPNGDGLNDNFKIVAKGIEQLQMKIYNRWGDLIYKSKEAHWDGRNLEGRNAAEGVYFYTINFKQIGNSQKTISGTFELMR